MAKSRGNGKGKLGKGKGKRKKCVYGVDEGDEAQWYPSVEWAEEGWAEEEEHAGAVYDEDDKMIAAFRACVCCPEPPMIESDDPFLCLLSDENCEEQVCAITS